VTEAPEASGEGHRAGAAPLDQYAAASKTTFALSPLASSTLKLFDQYAAASKASFALSPLAGLALKPPFEYAAASKTTFALSPLAGLALKPLFEYAAASKATCNRTAGLRTRQTSSSRPGLYRPGVPEILTQ
jgi:hypothetical protein